MNTHSPFVAEATVPAIQVQYPQKNAAGLIGVFVSLILLSAFVFLFGIEEQSGLPLLMFITLGAFAVHICLPLRHRPLFAVLLFAGTCMWALGWVTGGFVLFVSMCLIAIADLRWNFWLRIFLIGGITAGLVILRTNLFFAPRAIIASPFIASLFMFRLISYMYHQDKMKLKVPLMQRVSYFLLLPNLTFLLFPIVDYANYCKSYYNGNATEIYRRGIYRMTIGVLLIFLYRVVYYYASVDPASITNAPGFFSFIAVSYFLVIQIAGMMLISLGWITLFGYNLPTVFDNFFLANSFADLWRRINIYWRDFIKTTFYYPIYFRLRRKGEYTGLAVAGLIGFFISWMLHTYQLFWITGKFSIRAQDGIYWMTMGVLITGNGIIQYANAGKKIPRQRNTLFTILISGCRITGIFIYATLMWSIWNSDSLTTWIFLAGKATHNSFNDILTLFGYILICILVTGSIAYLFRNKMHTATAAPGEKWFPTVSWVMLSVAIVFILFSRSAPSDSTFAVLGEEIGTARVHVIDREMVDEGYYGQLLENGGAMSFRIKGFELLGDANWGNADGAMHRTGDIFLRVFNPDTSVLHYDFHMHINSFGMRDRQYTLEKPANTMRWIFLGGSYVTGFGVEAENTFGEILEKQFDDSLNRASGQHLEILNASSFGYGLIQQVALCETSISKYDADAVFYFAHPDESRLVAQMISKFVALGTNLEGYPEIQSVIERAGVDQTQSRAEMTERLKPFSEEVITWGYSSMVDDCRKNGIIPVWVFLPLTTDENTDSRYTYLQSLAQRTGFVCMNLSKVYAGRRFSEIQGGGIDTHPNELGHQLIASMLAGEIRKQWNSLTLLAD